MKTYIIHTEVQAAVVAQIKHKSTQSGTLTEVYYCTNPDREEGVEAKYEHKEFTQNDLMNKPMPKVGWYLVIYSDKYFNFVPAAAFVPHAQEKI